MPKSVFVERRVLEIGVNSAVLEFNEGAAGVHEVLKHFDVKTGRVTHKSSDKKNKQRTNNIKRKYSLKVKDRRKKLRGKQKGYLDLEKEKEGGDCYVPGGF